MKLFWNECCDVIIIDRDVPNKIFPLDSDYIVDVDI